MAQSMRAGNQILAFNYEKEIDEMPKAKNGDKVKVHYKGTLQDGTVFDTSEGRDPLEFTLGDGMVIPGFENAVVGLDAGETTTENIPSDEAYGPHRDEMVVSVPREHLPKDMNPEVGAQLHLQQPDGMVIPVLVKEIALESVTLDANHPLAGEDLTFEITLVEVV